MKTKIESFIKEKQLKDTVFEYAGEMFNDTNYYPENYYSYEEKEGNNYLYSVCRDKRSLRYKSIENEAYMLFLIKIMFIKYSNKFDIDSILFEEERKNISNIGKKIFYKEYLYYTVTDANQVEAEMERLNKRVCHLHMFIDELNAFGIIEKMEVSRVLQLMRN